MPEYSLWAEKLCHIYVAWPALRISAPPEPEHEAFWLTRDAAVLALGNDGDRHFLTRYLAGSAP